MAAIAKTEAAFAQKASDANAKVLDMNISMTEAVNTCNAMLNMRHSLWCQYGLAPDPSFKLNPLKPQGGITAPAKGQAKGQAKGLKRPGGGDMDDVMGWMAQMMAGKGKGACGAKGAWAAMGAAKGGGGGVGGSEKSSGGHHEQDMKNKTNQLMQVVLGRALTKEDLVYTVTSDEASGKHSATLANTYDPSIVLQSGAHDSRKEAQLAVAQQAAEWLESIAAPLMEQRKEEKKQRDAAKRARKTGAVS